MDQPKGHENIPLSDQKTKLSAQKAQVAAYPFEVAKAEPAERRRTGNFRKTWSKRSSERGQDRCSSGECCQTGGQGKSRRRRTVKPAEDKTENKADERQQPRRKTKKKRKGRSVKSRNLPAEVGKAERKADASQRKAGRFSLVDDKYLLKGSGTLAQPEVATFASRISNVRPGAQSDAVRCARWRQVRAYKDKESTLFRSAGGLARKAIQRWRIPDRSAGCFSSAS